MKYQITSMEEFDRALKEIGAELLGERIYSAHSLMASVSRPQGVLLNKIENEFRKKYHFTKDLFERAMDAWYSNSSHEGIEKMLKKGCGRTR